MKEELKDALQDKTLNIINWLEGAIKTSTDFASEQIPLFIQELLHYNFVMSLSWFILGIVGVITMVIGAILLIKWANKNFHVRDDACYFGLIFLSLGFVCSSLMVFNNLDWIKIKLAPRVYLMEYVKENLK